MKQALCLVTSLLMLLVIQLKEVYSQLAVYDGANHAQNSITSVQTFITAVEAVLIELNQILELTPVEDVVVAGGIAEDMALLATIIEEAQGLSYDLASLEAQIADLFDLETAPDTRDGLTERLAIIKRTKYESYRYVARVQTLLRTAIRTTEHLIVLVESIGAFIGNMTANQNINQTQVTMGKTLTTIEVQLTTFHRAQTVDKLSEAVIIESVNRIQAKRMEDWPRW